MAIPLIGPIIAGLGKAAGAIGLGGAAAGAAGGAAAKTGLSALMSKLGPTALQAGIGYALGGPQGALQIPLMGMTAGASPGAGLLGAALGNKNQLLMPILGGLAGRVGSGHWGGGLQGMGMGGLLDPNFGPFAPKPIGGRPLSTPGSTSPDPMLRIASPGTPFGPRM